MKSMLRSSIVLIVALAFIGCANQGSTVRTKQGAVVGAAVGGVAGAVIGHQSGQGLEGAAIGAGVGAVAGGVTGSAMDEKENQNKQNQK